MSKTIHRKDIGMADFTLLAQFSGALRKVRTPFGDPVVCQLGTIIMMLPVWYRTGEGWVLAGYKEFNREAIGIAKADMRSVCNYLNVREPRLIDTLYRLSMLGVVPGATPHAKPRFRMPFAGTYLSDPPFISSANEGFIIEKRRVEGLFGEKSREKD
jgi:hypothetical protein